MFKLKYSRQNIIHSYGAHAYI